MYPSCITLHNRDSCLENLPGEERVTVDPLKTLAKVDVVSRVAGVAYTFLRADWGGAWERYGVWGIPVELGRCIARVNAP